MSTIFRHVSQTGHWPDRPLVPGTARTVTDTCTGHSQTADNGGEHTALPRISKGAR